MIRRWRMVAFLMFFGLMFFGLKGNVLAEIDLSINKLLTPNTIGINEYKKYGILKKITDGQFKRIDNGEKIVFFYQRKLGDADVEMDFLNYQFDKKSGKLTGKNNHWRDNIDESKKYFLISKTEINELAKKRFNGEVLFSNLLVISPESNVYKGILTKPIEPVWSVRMKVDENEYNRVFNGINGEYLGEGVVPPYSSFSLSGPMLCPNKNAIWLEWLVNAEKWFKKLGYPVRSQIEPIEKEVIAEMLRNPKTYLFYELAHGNSQNFLNRCSESVFASDIENWLTSRNGSPNFSFVGSCGGLCETGNDTLSYELRRGSDQNTTVVGYCGMGDEICANCFNLSVRWQDKLFEYMFQGKTVKESYDQAMLDYPICDPDGSGLCMRFVGDEGYRLDHPRGGLRGLVTGSGQVVAEAEIEVTDVNDETNTFITTTDVNGKFEISKMLVGSYKLNVYSDQFHINEPIGVNVEENEIKEVNVVMLPGSWGTISGTVEDRKNGDLVAGAEILIDHKPVDPKVYSDKDGKFVIQVPSGNRSIRTYTSEVDQKFRIRHGMQINGIKISYKKMISCGSWNGFNIPFTLDPGEYFNREIFGYTVLSYADQQGRIILDYKANDVVAVRRTFHLYKDVIADYSIQKTGSSIEHKIYGNAVNSVTSSEKYSVDVATGKLEGNGQLNIYYLGIEKNNLNNMIIFGDPNISDSCVFPPVLDHIGDKSINEGSLLRFKINGSDPEGDELTYSASNLPQGANFSPTTKEFSWRPVNGQKGNYQVTFTVTDGIKTDSETIAINVNHITTADISLDIEDIPDPVRMGGLLTYMVKVTNNGPDDVISGSIVRIFLPNRLQYIKGSGCYLIPSKNAIECVLLPPIVKGKTKTDSFVVRVLESGDSKPYVLVTGNVFNMKIHDTNQQNNSDTERTDIVMK